MEKISINAFRGGMMEKVFRVKVEGADSVLRGGYYYAPFRSAVVDFFELMFNEEERGWVRLIEVKEVKVNVRDVAWETMKRNTIFIIRDLQKMEGAGLEILDKYREVGKEIFNMHD